MIDAPRTAKTIAVLSWRSGDGIREMLCNELETLNCSPISFAYGSPIPELADVLLSFGPYGQLLPVWQQAASLPAERRPVIVHWNTEGMPDLRLSMPVMHLLSSQTSRLGRILDAIPKRHRLSRWVTQLVQPTFVDRMSRFRYTGDYDYAYHRGWLHVLADTSAIYSRRRASFGLPTLYAPWGATSTWYADLKLKRDIDVLWMGTRGSTRRSRLLDRVRGALQSRGVRMHVADNVENPFIFKAVRTEYLNRAKITLNLTRTWYDDNFSRFALAASNRSLIVSEPVLPHCPDFEAGKHYVSVPTSHLAETILFYIQHENERQRIVEQAYQLVTTKLNFGYTLKRVLHAAVSGVQAGGVRDASAWANSHGEAAPGQPGGDQPRDATSGLYESEAYERR
jgi:hypothetical protein